MDKIIEHLKTFYSIYLVVVGLSTGSVGGYRVYDEIMTEIAATKTNVEYNQMLIFEFMLHSVEKEHPDGKFTDMEWQYYSIQANTLENLQEKFERDSGWVKMTRKQ